MKIARVFASLVLLVLGTACAPHYVFDKERQNKRVHPFVYATKETARTKKYDETVARFPGVKNLPSSSQLAGHVVAPSKFLDLGRPDYPEDLIDEGQRGHLSIAVLISEEGTVLDAKVLRSDNKKLNDSAVASAKRWRFSPATLDGKPIKNVLAMPFDYRLRPRF